jgi:predicted nucleotidyltransferase
VNVSMPISTVVPSLDGPVLAALASTTAPLSLADVHRLARRGSKSGVRQVLVRMTAEGLVHDVAGGYVLNRDHVAAPAVELLANLHGELVARLRAALEAWSGEVILAGLFGSAARRDGDASSDIDVLVVSDDSDLELLTDELASQVRVWTGNAAQVVGLTSTDLRRLRRAKEPIVAGWERDLLVLCGDRSVLRRSR